MRSSESKLRFLWLVILLGGLGSSHVFGQTLAYFRKAPTGFEWGWGGKSGVRSVKSWAGPFADTAAAFDRQFREAFHASRSTGVSIHLGPGRWTTRGMNATANSGLFNNGDLLFALSGDGMGITTLQLEDDAPYDPCQGFLLVISNAGAGHTHSVRIQDLTIDCNWPGQNTVVKTNCTQGTCRDTANRKGEAAYKCGFKVGGIAMSAAFGLIERVEVVNFGANGMRPLAGAGVEAFGILLTTADYGQTDTPLVIRNCRVGQFQALNGGYCTGISLVTRDPGPWTRANPYGKRTNRLALVESNEVFNLPGGIAYGCAFAEQVTFSRNKADGCATGFNCDSVGEGAADLVTGIVLEENLFTNVFSGINFGAPGFGNPQEVKFSAIHLRNNSIHLLGDTSAQCWSGVVDRPPFCGWVESFGIRLQGATGDVHISGNRFSAAPRAMWQDSLGPRTTAPNFLPIQVIRDANYSLVPGCDCIRRQPIFNADPILDAPNYVSRIAGTFGDPIEARPNAPAMVP